MWNTYEIETGNEKSWQLGHHLFWVRRTDAKNWQIAKKYFTNKQSIPTEVIETNELEWNNFFLEGGNKIELLPALPDRAMVIKPASNIKLLPDESLELFVNLPVWIQIYAYKKQERKFLHEFPSKIMSSTWFGENDAGELAYSMDNRMSLIESDLEDSDARITCKIVVMNESDEIMDFQRLNLRVEHLAIYRKNNKLFATPVEFQYKGTGELSRVSYSTEIGKDKAYTLVNKERVRPDKNILKRSFSFIKSVYQ